MGRVLSMLLSLIMLVGCGESRAPALTPEPIKPPSLTYDVILSGERSEETDAAYADFALDLLRQSRTEGENTLLSPLSVTLALGMTAQGANRDTAGEFETLFGMDRDALLRYCRALIDDYTHLGGSSEATVVNSLWCDPDVVLEGDFLAYGAGQIGAKVFQADLQSGDTVKAVNNWVNDATHGMIPGVVDHFDEEALLALINAVYFKNQFQHPFETPTHAWTLDFYNADGTVAQPQGMSNGTRRERYLSHEGGQGVVLPYDDDELGLLLMLPEEGTSLTDYLARWDGSTIQDLLEDQTTARMVLRVPKFKTEWSAGLEDALKALGLTHALDPATADFSAMGQSKEGYPLYIGQVIHKTAFELNEKGTEAAAVTAVIMDAATAMPPNDLIYLTFDRPFVYGIVDLDTGTPLFLGTLEQL